MHLGLLTQWYDPEPGPAALPGALARGLAARGHTVSVLTGFPNYPTGRLADGYRIRPVQREERDGVHVTRVALYPSHGAGAAGRILTYGSFGATAATLGLPTLRGLDALWVNYSPVTVGAAQLLAHRLFGVPSVCHVADLWPDTLGASGVDEDSPVGRLAIAGSGRLADAMYRDAAAVSYIAPSVGQLLEQRGVPADKLEYTPMWGDEQLFFPGAPSMRDELDIDDDRIVLVYAGALGEAQGLQTLVEACAVVDDPRFLCLVAGSGTAEESLRARAGELGLDNLRFLGRVAPERMSNLLATADVAFVGLNDHPLARMTMPSKTQATMAAGRPMLVAGQGDLAGVVEASGAGWTVPSGDVQALAAAIRTVCSTPRPELAGLGRRAREYYDSTFSLQAGVDRIERLLVRIATQRKAS